MASVFVSGATGFIAQHIVKNLIAKGYKVVGSVRSAAKGDALKANLKSDSFTYEIVPDIATKGAFDEALKSHPEVSVFLHTASPFHFHSVDHEKEMLIPAVEGTKNALIAVKEHAPQVKRVVVTSSYAAILTVSKNNKDTVFNEDSWNEITWDESKSSPANAYLGSKTFAERAAWDFVKSEKPNFKLTTVNPVGALGPQAFNSEVRGTLNTSAEIVNRILKLKADDKVNNSSGPFVDVRDVANAHLVAFEKEEAAGQRLLLFSAKYGTQDLLDIINEKFSALLNGKLPKGEPGTGKEATEKTATIENNKTRKLLGFELIGLEKSVVDTVQQIYDATGKL